ncbi:S8 family peptidase [Roseateles sp.]|uniref:S8 family peptidase n=1 Tax=Roseateles sp. TaxID=1971397 RepID=UPI00286D14AB|nr:S8 family peptidase [Roseateles sp.]
MKLRPISLAAVALLAGFAATTQAQEARRSYIIQMADKPAASYTGGVVGQPATKAAQGTRLDLNSSAVQSFISYLEDKQNLLLATVPSAEVTHQYQVVFNGFAAQLTDAEVRKLKKNPDVALIMADSISQPMTSYTPTFLGLDKIPGGLWEQNGGKSKAGEGMIIGLIDSGIWPENPSFADRVDGNGVPTHDMSGTLAYDAPPAKWTGGCDVRPGIVAANCNNKLIGIRSYRSAAQTFAPQEFDSGRDATQGAGGGHGSHTASTAGGNNGVLASSAGNPLGSVSGIAPRARIAAYKVCWKGTTANNGGCAGSNTVAAVEQAVKDGVDVLNYSIGPTAGGGTFQDAAVLAFLGASNAGVFVAASAGNSGPSTAPAANLGPWHATVGNSTHNRLYSGTATLGNDTKVVGSSTNPKTDSANLILAQDAGVAGLSVSDQARLKECFGTTDLSAPSIGGAPWVSKALIDPAKVSGKILVCDRGNNALVNKSANAKTAGATGVILGNVAGGATNTANAPHTLSTVHVTSGDATVVKTYMAANPGVATASLGDLNVIVNPNVPAPVMAGSSSRGPNVANANILKPDMTAPGSDILASVTPAMTQGERDAIAAGGSTTAVDWAFYTGTSMSSPHVAGLAALIKQQHPTWTPAMIKSALMTTAKDTESDGLNGALPWDPTAKNTGKLPWAQGAGHVVPNLASDPGLVYDATEADYDKFMCGVGITPPGKNCGVVGSIPAYNLNLPSLTAASVLGVATLTRTVTNVGTAPSTYTAAATVAGYDVVVSPASFTIQPGAKQTFTVKLTRTSAPLATWAYGNLTWTDNLGHKVRSPLTARGSTLIALDSVSSEAQSGSKVFTVGSGFAGSLVGVKAGLQAAVRDSRNIGQADNGTSTATCRAGGGVGVNVHNVTIPAGTLAARFALYDEETTGGGASDLDLAVFNAAGTLVASSGTDGSNELVQIKNPVAGAYKVCVVGYAPLGGSADYTLSSWVLDPAAASSGNFKALLPSKVFVGGNASVGISWSGLAPAKRHLGALSFVVNGAALGMTMVEVNTNDPLPLFQNSRVEMAETN